MTAILSLLLIVISVYILAVITDEFFIISLDEVATKLQMPSDVAGASLMAIGSSAPELFIALIAVVEGGAHGDVGIGTIVGSAVFNILVITGVSAIVAKDLLVERGGVERDIIFYLGTVALLLFVFWDGTILMWEATLLVVTYLFYIFILWRWGENNPEEPGPPKLEEHPEGAPPKFIGTVNHVIATVFRLITRDPKENYIWTLIISIASIAGISWVLVQGTVSLSDALGLPPVIVSLTLLAAGTSAPDLIASMNVARDGRGEMAIANAVGSDIFDVLIGLGLPWLITIIFLRPTVEVESAGLVPSVFILIITVLILYAFLYTGRKLTRLEGWGLLATYGAYIAYAIWANTGGA